MRVRHPAKDLFDRVNLSTGLHPEVSTLRSAGTPADVPVRDLLAIGWELGRAVAASSSARPPR